MFTNGIATIFVTDMDRSVKFYTEVLGLKLAQRFGNHWAQLEAGQLSIGLHPASPETPAGRNGSTTIGLSLAGSIEDAVSKLRQKGVRFRGPVAVDPPAGKFAYFEDPDGNELYMIEVANWQTPSSTPSHEYADSR